MQNPYRIPKTSDPLYRRLGWSLAGLAKIRDGNRKLEEATLLGSGTFVKTGSVSGILTAAHVLELVRDDTIGLMTFHRDEPIGQFKIDVREGDRVFDPKWKTSQRDLAFLRLADQSRVTDLEALGCVFHNLDRAREIPRGRPEIVIAGVVGETREIKPRDGQAPITGYTALFGPAVLRATADGERFVVEPQHRNDRPPPSSYGGMSGGAAWVAVAADQPLILLGVLYREDFPADGSATIGCESLWAAYQTLLPEVRSQCS